MHRSLHLIPTLGQINPSHAIEIHLFVIYFNIILSCVSSHSQPPPLLKTTYDKVNNSLSLCWYYRKQQLNIKKYGVYNLGTVIPHLVKIGQYLCCVVRRSVRLGDKLRWLTFMCVAKEYLALHYGLKLAEPYSSPINTRFSNSPSLLPVLHPTN
jgi:hypothetical protein